MTGNDRNFYLATVKPTVDEFLASCTDVRRGRRSAALSGIRWDLLHNLHRKGQTK